MPELIVEVCDQMGQKHRFTFLHIQKPRTNKNLFVLALRLTFILIFSLCIGKIQIVLKKKPYISHPY